MLCSVHIRAGFLGVCHGTWFGGCGWAHACAANAPDDPEEVAWLLVNRGAQARLSCCGRVGWRGRSQCFLPRLHPLLEGCRTGEKVQHAWHTERHRVGPGRARSAGRPLLHSPCSVLVLRATCTYVRTVRFMGRLAAVAAVFAVRFGCMTYEAGMAR